MCDRIEYEWGDKENVSACLIEVKSGQVRSVKEVSLTAS